MTSINSLLIAVIAAVWGASSVVAADMALEASPTAPNCITCTNYIIGSRQRRATSLLGKSIPSLPFWRTPRKELARQSKW
jgi:hypothetical protein